MQNFEIIYDKFMLNYDSSVFNVLNNGRRKNYR